MVQRDTEYLTREDDRELNEFLEIMHNSQMIFENCVFSLCTNKQFRNCTFTNLRVEKVIKI